MDGWIKIVQRQRKPLQLDGMFYDQNTTAMLESPLRKVARSPDNPFKHGLIFYN